MQYAWVVESPAPGIIDRQSVFEPLQTGVISIDSMIPIGRGQRELIVGDRKTGKTSIGVDSILNQKYKKVFCIYVPIGQKASSILEVFLALIRKDAIFYLSVLIACGSSSAVYKFIYLNMLWHIEKFIYCCVVQLAEKLIQVKYSLFIRVY